VLAASNAAGNVLKLLLKKPFIKSLLHIEIILY